MIVVWRIDGLGISKPLPPCGGLKVRVTPSTVRIPYWSIKGMLPPELSLLSLPGPVTLRDY